MSGQCFWLAEANFRHGTTNQKHNADDLGSDASSVWNFCAGCSDVISRGNQWWHCEMVAVFLGYRRTVFSAELLVVCTWPHGGHVGDQEQKHFSPLGTQLHFHVYSTKNMTIYRFDHQHGRLITWLQTKNSSLFRNKDCRVRMISEHEKFMTKWANAKKSFWWKHR